MKKVFLIIVLLLSCGLTSQALAQTAPPTFNCTGGWVCSCAFTGTVADTPVAVPPHDAAGCQTHCLSTNSSAYSFVCDETVIRPSRSGSQYVTVSHTASGPTTSGTVATPARDPILPCLNVPIVGLKFGNCDATGNQIGADSTLVVNADGKTTTNLLGTYVEAVYQYLLIAASIVAVTMLMIAGLQYATARGEAKQVDQAKKRINNAIVGIILLLLAYNIAFIINPATTTFGSLGFDTVALQQLNSATSGPEGDYNYTRVAPGASGSWENLSSPYKDLVAQAKKQSSACAITEGFKSPAGGDQLPNQSAHHWGKGLAAKNYSKVTNLDWAATWGAPIYAPFNATSISYTTSKTINKCGNQINLKTASGETITICHVKDFIGEGGAKLTGAVKQGQVIGHLGGKCCAGSTAPQGWYTECDVQGATCNPEVAGSCDCQTLVQAGNTTGPHIHVTMKGKSNILACLTP